MFPKWKKCCYYAGDGETRTPSFLLNLPVRTCFCVNLSVTLSLCGWNTFSGSFEICRLLVLFLLPSCTSSSWRLSPGCSWKVCSSTSCWWRFLRVNTPGGSTSIWLAMACLHWSWLCQQQWTTGAMAQTKCEWGLALLGPGQEGGRGEDGGKWGGWDTADEGCCAGSCQLKGTALCPSAAHDHTAEIPHHVEICKGVFLENSVAESFIASLITSAEVALSSLSFVSTRSPFLSNQRVFLICTMKHCFFLLY